MIGPGWVGEKEWPEGLRERREKMFSWATLSMFVVQLGSTCLTFIPDSFYSFHGIVIKNIVERWRKFQVCVITFLAGAAVSLGTQWCCVMKEIHCHCGGRITHLVLLSHSTIMKGNNRPQYTVHSVAMSSHFSLSKTQQGSKQPHISIIPSTTPPHTQ